MTQIKEGYSYIREFAARPDLTPRFSGIIGHVSRGHRSHVDMFDEKTRRTDGLQPHYGQGTPKINSTAVDVWGLACATEQVAYEEVGTSEGSVKVPIEREHLQYLPNTGTLDFLTHGQDTRLDSYPSRFFR